MVARPAEAEARRPPFFRPRHLEAVIAAGKHVFTEKPVAVDALGVRSVIATSEAAASKGLAIVAEPQYGNIFDHFAVEYEYPNGAQVARLHGTRAQLGLGDECLEARPHAPAPGPSGRAGARGPDSDQDAARLA